MEKNRDVNSDAAPMPGMAAILGNLESFERNNSARIKRLRQQASEPYRRAFFTVPVLLHLNYPGVPGYVDSQEAPFGLRGFQHSPFADAGRNCLPKTLTEYQRIIMVDRPIARALFLIGSPGTVGYTGGSDLDYWICLDRWDLSPSARDAYRKKLDIISAWIRIKLGVEVNFYPTNRQDLAANILRASAKETEGEVAPLVVKEELYRTLLHVVGSRPLWWGAPPDIDPSGYQALVQDLAGSALEREWDLIDYGYPFKPPPQEYLAAALWLSRKSEEDPFKGVLKMMLILEQVETRFESPPLSEIMKKKILAAGPADLPIDPYILIAEQVLAQAKVYLPPKLVELVRMAVFFKIRGPLDGSESFGKSGKAPLLEKLAADWGWDQRTFDRLTTYAAWPEQDRLALGTQFKNLLYVLYTRVAKRLLAEYPGRVTPDDQNLGAFKARILARYSDHQASVESLPSSLDRKTLPSVMTLVETNRDWQLFSGVVELFQMGVKKSKGQMIYRADRAARIAAWLVSNQIPVSKSDRQFHYHASCFDRRSFLRLVDTLEALFPPFGAPRAAVTHGWASGADGPRLIVVNMETPKERHLTEIDLIYRTKWGEMRHQSVLWNQDADLAQRNRDVYNMVRDAGDFEQEDIILFFHQSPVGKKIGNNLGAVLAGQAAQKHGPAKGWLDTE